MSEQRQLDDHLGWADRSTAEAWQKRKRGSVLLAMVDSGVCDDWIVSTEADESGAPVLCWGVSSTDGERMLDEDGKWVVVA